MKNNFFYLSDLIGVRVKIWDITTQSFKTAKFIVDTGSTKSIIDIDVAKSLGYTNYEKKISLSSLSSRTAKGFSLRLKKVQLWDITRQNINFMAVDFPISLINIDGILGLNFFRQKELCINFANQTISLK